MTNPIASTDALMRGVDKSMTLAERLFDNLRENTKDGPGVTRASWGPGEQYAHDLLEAAARDLDLEIEKDHVGNLYMTLPGADRDKPRMMTGSHLDSVPQGGNFDGAAGVVAGITALAAMREAGLTPHQDICVMGVRAEECGSWFVGRHGGHLGSRIALGLLWPDEMDTAIHTIGRRTMRQAIAEAGFDPEAAEASPWIDPKTVRTFIELHIEQGPVLVDEKCPVGVVTAIRGNFRVRNASCTGVYAHSGGEPQYRRRDAVLSYCELMRRFEEEIEAGLAQGRDIVFASGVVHTDPEQNAVPKVPGYIDFTMDVRSQELDYLKVLEERTKEMTAEIAERRGVSFDLGTFDYCNPTIMTPNCVDALRKGADQLGLTWMDIPSGGGHDCQEFYLKGAETCMIFFRNDKGSHNPYEEMELEDFAEATRLLTWFMATQ